MDVEIVPPKKPVQDLRQDYWYRTGRYDQNLRSTDL